MRSKTILIVQKGYIKYSRLFQDVISKKEVWTAVCNMIINNVIIEIINQFIYNDINIIVLIGNLGGLIVSDINVLLEKAINETEKLNDGEIFLLRDLFKGYEWNRISRSTRLLLGTLFLNKISNENLDISATAKTSSGQQKYQIVRRNNHA